MWRFYFFLICLAQDGRVDYCQKIQVRVWLQKILFEVKIKKYKIRPKNKIIISKIVKKKDANFSVIPIPPDSLKEPEVKTFCPFDLKIPI